MEEAPQLFLTIEALPGPATIARLQAALTAGPIATVRLLPPADSVALDASVALPLVRLIQEHGAAALLQQDASLARMLGADGVHLGAATGLEEVYVSAREKLGPASIVGVEITNSRHDAMSLGELGADYIAFSGPERDELAHWWSEVFVVPCVALGIEEAGETAAVAATGADFLGLTLAATAEAGDAEALIRTCASGLGLGTGSAAGKA